MTKLRSRTPSPYTTNLIDELFMEYTCRGYTLSYIVNKSGVTRGTLRKWFRGETLRPQASTLNAVGKVFGWTLDWKR